MDEIVVVMILVLRFLRAEELKEEMLGILVVIVMAGVMLVVIIFVMFIIGEDDACCTVVIVVMVGGKNDDCCEVKTVGAVEFETVVSSISPILLTDGLVASISVVDCCDSIPLSELLTNVPGLPVDSAKEVTPEVPLIIKDVIVDCMLVFAEVPGVKAEVPVEGARVGCNSEVDPIVAVPDRTI